MKFETKTLEFLKGEKFSNGLDIKVAERENSITDRITFLKGKVEGKSIIHVGFTDHVPLIQQKINKNIWLHKILSDVAEKCIGIDIDYDAVEFVKNNYGFGDLFVHDLTGDTILEEITKQKWDYMIIGEVLEHIDNPVNFLNTVKEKYGNWVERIIITVPNAFDLINIRKLRHNIEFINTDHRYWFTPFTLAKVCTRAGFDIESFHYCNSFAPVKWLPRFLLKRFPVLREGIIMVIV